MSYLKDTGEAPVLRISMRIKTDPKWKELLQSWKATQDALRARLIIAPLRPLPRFVAGADAAFSRDDCHVFAVAVVYDRLEDRVIEISQAVKPLRAPYIPTFLSFREGDALADAIGQLKHPFGVICFDGQGMAHPRRCGLATHMGVSLDVPSIGCAKSRLIGTYSDPSEKRGSTAWLMDGPERIGSVLRTREGCRPIFLSIGHRVDLSTARALVLSCCTRYRIPEPTRLADIEVSKMKRKIAQE